MKTHYDFSKGERGKFHRPDAAFRLPLYLDQKVERYLVAKAEAKGVDLSELANDLLRREIEIMGLYITPVPRKRIVQYHPKNSRLMRIRRQNDSRSFVANHQKGS